MKHLKLSLLLILLVSGAHSAAQQYSVGDSVHNFTVPICENGSGTWELRDYNGAVNGGDYHVIYIDLFTSW